MLARGANALVAGQAWGAGRRRFALGLLSIVGPGVARSLLGLGTAALIPALFWPAYALGVALGVPGLQGARLQMLVRAVEAAALVPEVERRMGACMVLGLTTTLAFVSVARG